MNPHDWHWNPDDHMDNGTFVTVVILVGLGLAVVGFCVLFRAAVGMLL